MAVAFECREARPSQIGPFGLLFVLVSRHVDRPITQPWLCIRPASGLFSIQYSLVVATSFIVESRQSHAQKYYIQ